MVIFVWSFMKISGTVLKLQSGHDFVTDRQTDKQTDRRTEDLGKNNMSLNPNSGRHNDALLSICDPHARKGSEITRERLCLWRNDCVYNISLTKVWYWNCGEATYTILKVWWLTKFVIFSLMWCKLFTLESTVRLIQSLNWLWEVWTCSRKMLHIKDASISLRSFTYGYLVKIHKIFLHSFWLNITDW